MKISLFLAAAAFTLVSFMTSCGEKTTAGTATTKTTTSTSESTPTKAIDHLKIDAFKKLVDDKAGVLIDVRTPQEHGAGHIAGTDQNVNVSSPDFKEIMGQMDKDKTYLIYCRSGGRSRRAMGIMESMGFKNIYDLSGGYLGWSKAGYK